MKNKILNKLTVKWNKKENCFGWKYPCRQGDGLGYEISSFMNKLMKDYNWKDFDFTTLKVTIEVTAEKYKDLVKNPPECR